MTLLRNITPEERGHTASTVGPDHLEKGELWCYICKEVVIFFLSPFQGTATSLTWTPKAEPDLDDGAREQVTEGRGRCDTGEHDQGRQIPQLHVADRCVMF